MKKGTYLSFTLMMLILIVGCKKQETKEISTDALKDKIAGGWAGKMIGVSYGAKSEFRFKGEIKEDSIEISKINNSIGQDDIYVQLTFMETMDKYGVDAPLKQFQADLANAGFMLWHANLQARKNYFDSIFPPESGMPENNIHADDIDFQIESDYIGFMNPGMPQSSNKIAGRIGQIMNYGDGIYGGMFIAALYSEAFFDNDIEKVIDHALLSIPAESEYSKLIGDVIKLHKHNPNDWRASWHEIQNKWGETDMCGAGDKFNIDAKLNGAYIIMGLLYGDGDAEKTMEITTRCGQDADCNPSNAMAVLGIVKGFSNLPKKMQSDVLSIADSTFENTNYSFNKAVSKTMQYAIDNIKNNGGNVKDNNLTVVIQQPKAPALTQSFPNTVLDKSISIFDSTAWVKKGNWKDFYTNYWWVDKPFKQALYADKNGDEISINFNGTGFSLIGNWQKDGGKADIYLDNQLMRTINTWYLWNGFQQEGNMDLYHKFNLPDGKHTVKLVVKGEKYAKSEGTAIYINELRVFKTAPKKSETYKLSFEK
jgi:hypothetical protein